LRKREKTQVWERNELRKKFEVWNEDTKVQKKKSEKYFKSEENLTLKEQKKSGKIEAWKVLWVQEEFQLWDRNEVGKNTSSIKSEGKTESLGKQSWKKKLIWEKYMPKEKSSPREKLTRERNKNSKKKSRSKRNSDEKTTKSK